MIVLLLLICLVNSFEMWQITDIHLDPMYKEGTDPLTLCRNGKGNVKKLGDYSCDTSSYLLETLKSYIKRHTKDNGKVILFNGDIVTRAIPNYNEQFVKESITNLTNFLKTFDDYFIIPMLGNHDIFPTNQMSAKSQWLFDFAANSFKPFLTNEAYQSFLKGGYYTMPFPVSLGIKTPLNVVVLNTVLYYNYNKQTIDGTDPLGQFKWFENTMNEYRKSGQKVIIGMHICPGVAERFNYSDQLYPQYNDRLVDEIVEYDDVILGVMCGHLHTDTYRILSKGSKKVIAFISSSIDTWLGTSPSIRKYDVGDGTTYLKSYKNYNLLLEQPIDNKKTTVKSDSSIKYNKWKFNYESSSQYGLIDLSPKQFEILTERFEQDLQLFQKYHSHFRGDTPGFKCDGICKNNCICAIRYPRQNQFSNCVIWR